MTLYVIATIATLGFLGLASVLLFKAGKLAGKLEVVQASRGTYHHRDILEVVQSTL